MNFHSDEWIMERVKEHYEEAKTLFPEDHIVGIFLQGSQNYGLDVDGSDIDTKVIVTPTLDDIIFNRKPISTTHIRENNEHIDIKDIRLYLQTFRKQNINFIEILFTKYCIINTKYKYYWSKLIEQREAIAHYNVRAALKAMYGVAYEKYHAMKKCYPSKLEIMDKFGYDPKQLHHLLRVGYFIDGYLANWSYADCLQLPENKQKYLSDIKSCLYDTTRLPLFSVTEAESIAEKELTRIKTLVDNYNGNDEIDLRVEYLLDDVQRALMVRAVSAELYDYEVDL